MGKYIHLFETENDFNAAYNGTAYTEPWVSYTKQDENVDYNKDMRTIPFTIESLGSGNITWALGDKTVQYSKNGGEWTTMDSGTSIPVSNGDKVQFKGDNDRYAYNGPGFYVCTISSTARFNVSGNIMSLIDSQGFENASTLIDWAFYGLFSGSTTITSAENLLLPATTIGKGVYEYMFGGCANLVSGPKKIYLESMGDQCCEYMFTGCTSLVNAPELPSTNLYDNCYLGMFKSCTSLVKAPELPAETLFPGCYNMMFEGCSILNYVKSLSKTNPTNNTSYWLYGVSPTGTFVKAAGVTWPTGDSGIPSGWTVQEA